MTDLSNSQMAEAVSYADREFSVLKRSRTGRSREQTGRGITSLTRHDPNLVWKLP